MRRTLLFAAVTLPLSGVAPPRARATWYVGVSGVPREPAR